jgi:hypothetical protein
VALVTQTRDGATQLLAEVVLVGAAAMGEFDVLEVLPDALVERVAVGLRSGA